SGSVLHGTYRGAPGWARTGNPAAATAAGLVEVWSSIRLLITRGWESKTDPVFWAYDENGTAGLPGPKNPAGAPSADPNTGVVSRRNGRSAAPKASRPGARVLQEAP